MIIKDVRGREILDSRGNPTVEVELVTNRHRVRASVPSGASTGVHEARELRDNKQRYHGQGVQQAVDNIRLIRTKIIGLPVKQGFIDDFLIELDGTPNKTRLGANAILPVSMAVCRAGALSRNLHLYEYIGQLAGTKPVMPTPYLNVINGGKHAGNLLDIQEYMIIPKNKSFKESLRMGVEVYHTLKGLLKKYGPGAVNVGDEGGFAPPFVDNEDPLRLLTQAIAKAGYANKVNIALDCAASEFFSKGNYLLNKKTKNPQRLSPKDLEKLYRKYISKYPIISIEDPFDQDDWNSWSDFMRMSKVQVVGDDLLVTNIARIQKALHEKACNSLLLKINQIGTITEAIEAAKLSFKHDWKVIVSHRSGETEDTFISDLAVGLGCGRIKTGAPCRGERVAKFNQLLRIEENF